MAGIGIRPCPLLLPALTTVVDGADVAFVERAELRLMERSRNVEAGALLGGALRQPPWSYVQILGTYLIVLILAVTVAIVFKDFILLHASRHRGFWASFRR